MKKNKANKIIIFLSGLLLLLTIFTPISLANSAEPPGLTVIVSFPPEDLTLAIRFTDGSVADAVLLYKEQKAWEAYYRFFYGLVAAERPSFEGAVLVVESSGENFELPLPESTFGEYNNLLTLDIKSKTVSEGQSLGRSILLVSMRVILTMLIEGLVFFAFGYRKKTSWIAFIVINLITQSALNIALSGSSLGSYWIFAFAFYEMDIFVAEGVAFAFILKEYTKNKAIAFTFAANLASLILGGILISYLPV